MAVFGVVVSRAAVSRVHTRSVDKATDVQIVRRSLDWLMLCAVVLCCIGLIMAVSISGPQEDVGALLAMKRQGAKLAVGLVAFLAAAMIPLHWLWRCAG